MKATAGKRETITVAAAARMLSCCNTSIRRAVQCGKLHAVYSKLTPGRIKGIVRADVDKLLRESAKA